MRNIVIPGAGPIGLFLAISLARIIKQYELDVTITVVDPRVGEYDRPGVVANKVLDFLGGYLKMPIEGIRRGDDTGTSMFIQDLETALYRIAQKFNIKFERAQVQDLEPGTVKAKKKDGSVVRVPCDLALDCTGQNRQLATILNQSESDRKPFEIKRIGDNPIKNHFVAYVNMDAKNAELVSEKMKKDPLKHSHQLSLLRAKFGWTEFADPEFTSRKYTSESEEKKATLPASANPVPSVMASTQTPATAVVATEASTVDASLAHEKKNELTVRQYFYYEIPPSLVDANMDKQKEWLRALLQLLTENDNIDFEIEAGKMKFIPFPVDPHRVLQPFFMSTRLGILTILCGDALIEPDYRLGVGIWSGIMRAMALLNSIQIDLKNRELNINTALYEQLLQEPIARHVSELEKDYRLKNEALFNVLEREEKRYLEAIARLSALGSERELDIFDKKMMERDLEVIQSRIAMKWHQDGLQEYKKALDQNGEIKLDKYHNVVEVDALMQSKATLIKSLAKLPVTKVDEAKVIKSTLQQLAQNYKKLAGKLFLNHKVSEAKAYYLEALDIYENYLPGSHLDEVVRIHSNLAMIANKRKDFNLALRHANQALHAIPEAKMADEAKLTAKIKINKCLAMVEIILVELAQANPRQVASMKEKVVEANNLFKELESGSHAATESASLVVLKNKMGDIEKRMVDRNTPDKQDLRL